MSFNAQYCMLSCVMIHDVFLCYGMYGFVIMYIFCFSVLRYEIHDTIGLFVSINIKNLIYN